MPDLPDLLTLKDHRDDDSRSRPIARRVGVGLLAALCLLGLANLFGQRPGTSKASTAAASLSVYAPAHVRSGLYFEARFHVVAHRELKKATLVLDPGWAESMQINTIEPSPVSEASRDGKLSFALGHVRAGESFLLFIEFQVNPTNIAWRRPQNVELFDGDTHLLTLKRKLTVYP